MLAKTTPRTILGLIMLALNVFLGACTNAPPAEKIILKTARPGGLLWLGMDNIVYVLNADQGGPIRSTLPPGLGDEPDWSADGEWIAFSSTRIEGGQAGGVSHIFVMRSDGSQRTAIADNGADPMWSPSGDQIVYHVWNTNEIYLADAKCVKENRVCELPALLGLGGRPTWSPDGKQIVYNTLESDGFTSDGITILTLETKTALKLPGSQECDDPRWSPKGSQIVASCKGAISIFTADGTSSLRLSGGGGAWPRWSPDGSRIAFLGGSHYDKNLGKGLNGEGTVQSNAIFVMNADGTNLKRLSLRNDEEVLWYSWMP